MAGLSTFTGGTPSEDGRHISYRFVTESEYEAISLVSNPAETGTYDPTSSDFDANYLGTLFYIEEDA